MSGRRPLALLAALGMAALVALGVVALGRVGGGVAEGEAPTPPTERVRVEVLNAGGVSGVARTATLRLRDTGFDVVQFGNARTFDRDSSVVIDRVGRSDLAEAVAKVLGIGNVLSEPDPNLFVDVTVLLGKTWSGPAGGGPAGEPSPRAAWDPRGWLGR